MLETTEAAIVQANIFHDSFVDLLPTAKSDTPLTTAHSNFNSWAAAKMPKKTKQRMEVSNVCASIR